MESYTPVGRTDTIENLITIAAVILIIIYANRRRFFGKLGIAKTGVIEGTSLVMAFFTQGYNLSRLKRAKIQGVRYNIFLTSQDNSKNKDEPNTKAGSMIYMLELPYSTTGHVIGISKKSILDRFFLESFLEAHGMEEIVLEGDYPNQFSIYASPGQQVISRYILDPAAMEFTVDYCTNHFWEIVGDEMYFATVDGLDSDEDILLSSIKFAEQVKPATADSANNQATVKHEVPYGELGDTPLKCPICNTDMEIGQYWFTCKNQHGILIPGPDLHKIKQKIHKVNKSGGQPVQHEGLHCPSCGSKMHPVDYLKSGVIIDSCTQCAYRWLDTNEAYKISNPKINSKI